ncbi:MAG TPA: tRNA (guanosine(37)-N1)-methyltransferase TrmD [Actinomycetota bacterium]|nr:tRNA (guanosine(37)-N1)-methyltransferase TrmD [Actinomycetota bacterium]
MRFDVITIFPEVFAPFLSASLLGKAVQAGIVEVGVHNLRDWGVGPHRKVDDEPFGGGAGMVMAAGPILEAVAAVRREGARVVLLAAAGRRFDQQLASELAGAPQVVLVCGRYEGIDDRVTGLAGAESVSVADVVLAGGEVPALLVVEAVARLVPGVLGNLESLTEESFTGGLLEYPQYTRPAELAGARVPEVLLSGDHGRVADWRRRERLRRTLALRPELLAGADLTEADRAQLAAWEGESPGE